MKSNPYYLLINLLYEEERLDEAYEVLKQLRRYDREDIVARKRRATVHIAREEWEGVVDYLWDAVYINPFDREIHVHLGEAYFQLEAWESALRELKVLAAFDNPDVFLIYPRMARCYLELENYEKAIEYANRTLEVNPGDSEAKRLLEEAQERQSK